MRSAASRPRAGARHGSYAAQRPHHVGPPRGAAPITQRSRSAGRACRTGPGAAGPRPPPGPGRSGEDAGEGVVELAGVVEDALRELVDGPVDGREVVLDAVAEAGEDLVAVPGRVEEVDRRP